MKFARKNPTALHAAFTRNERLATGVSIGENFICDVRIAALLIVSYSIFGNSIKPFIRIDRAEWYSYVKGIVVHLFIELRCELSNHKTRI